MFLFPESNPAHPHTPSMTLTLTPSSPLISTSETWLAHCLSEQLPAQQHPNSVRGGCPK